MNVIDKKVNHLISLRQSSFLVSIEENLRALILTSKSVATDKYSINHSPFRKFYYKLTARPYYKLTARPQKPTPKNRKKPMQTRYNNATRTNIQ